MRREDMGPHYRSSERIMQLPTEPAKATSSTSATLPPRTLILNELRLLRPCLKLTIRTSVPLAWIAERLTDPFAYVHQPDLGMVMANALHVQVNESALAYSFLHKHWNERVYDAAARLAALEPTLLLSNISYLSIAAASKAGFRSLR